MLHRLLFGEAGKSVLRTVSQKGRRERIDILATILYSALVGKQKTHIMNKASLNYKQVEEHFKLLMKTGLLRKDESVGRTLFKTTDKGFLFITRYEALKELIDD